MRLRAGSPAQAASLLERHTQNLTELVTQIPLRVPTMAASAAQNHHYGYLARPALAPGFRSHSHSHSHCLLPVTMCAGPATCAAASRQGDRCASRGTAWAPQTVGVRVARPLLVPGIVDCLPLHSWVRR